MKKEEKEEEEEEEEEEEKEKCKIFLRNGEYLSHQFSLFEPTKDFLHVVAVSRPGGPEFITLGREDNPRDWHRITRKHKHFRHASKSWPHRSVHRELTGLKDLAELPPEHVHTSLDAFWLQNELFVFLEVLFGLILRRTCVEGKVFIEIDVEIFDSSHAQSILVGDR